MHPCASAAGFGYRFWRHRGGLRALRALCTDLDWAGWSIRAPRQKLTLQLGCDARWSMRRGCEKRECELDQDSLILWPRDCVFRRPRWPVLAKPCPVSELSRACLVALSPTSMAGMGGMSNAESASQVSSLVRKSPAINTIEMQLQPLQSTPLQTTKTKNAVLSLTSDPAAKYTYVTCTYEHLRNIHRPIQASPPASTPAIDSSSACVSPNPSSARCTARCPIRSPQTG